MTVKESNCDHVIYVEWLRQSVLVFHDIDAARDEIGAMGGDARAGDGGAGYIVHDDGIAAFWMIFPGGSPSVPTMVHEAIHTVDNLCEFVDIPISADASEVRCYMTEWLMTKLLEIYGEGDGDG